MNKYSILGFIYLMIILGLLVCSVCQELSSPEFISPCPPEGCEVINWDEMITPTPSPTPTATPAPVIETSSIGMASYYSRAGCLGCSESLTMANGEPLDDSKLTVAYNRAKLNTYVKITNISSGLVVDAKVTDRGGFERHGKIIDLSVATKNALGCGDVCRVKVEEI